MLQRKRIDDCENQKQVKFIVVLLDIHEGFTRVV